MDNDITCKVLDSISRRIRDLEIYIQTDRRDKALQQIDILQGYIEGVKESATKHGYPVL